MKFPLRVVRALFTAALVLPVLSYAAEDAKFKKVRIDTTPNGVSVEAAVNQFPLLVRLHSGNFTFSEAKPDGSDLRFFSNDGKTALKFHVERFDAANELAMIWVQLPVLSANAKTDFIQVRWGNPGDTPGSDSKATYDNKQLLVLHFSDADGVKDASAYSNPARESGVRLVNFGAVGGAAAFDGNSRVLIPASDSLKLSAAEGWTFSTWVKPTRLESGSLFTLGGLTVSLTDGVPTVASGNQTVKASSALSVGLWQQLTAVFNAGKVQLLVNGVAVGDGALGMNEFSGEALVGKGFKGELDELTLSNTARSLAYVKALAGSQMAESSLLVFADEGVEEAGVSYMAILLGAVTLDGWVVIGILGIMAVVSLYVMVTKTIILVRSEKANLAFLDLFARQSLSMLDPTNNIVRQMQSMDALKASSIYQLYTVGLREIQQRFDAQQKNEISRNLSAPALESIRAALDATIVRTNQKFNQGIVLLTIAISGGPFLGLLGTVVGVMITFAAIAAAGDVNVNAIAPGIAAALVATVAGLAVAIPALFAYNWFAIKIKNISADTQVFADEFLTKSAELYSV
jgi:biopolymer transport protein ExbB